MSQTLTGAQQKHITYLVALFLTVLLLVRVCLIFPYMTDAPNAYEIIDKFLGELFASILVTGFLAWALPFLFPTERSVEEVKRQAVTEYFERAYLDTSRWDYSGSSATFTRAETLPLLDQTTRKGEKHVDVLVLINDPRNEAICERYADYKTLSGEEPWPVEQVRLELLATVVTCACFHLSNLRMPIRIGLKKGLSRYRYDVSTHYAIVTRETPTESALVVHSQSPRYQGILEEISCQRDQAEMLNLDSLLQVEGMSRKIAPKHVTEEQVLKMLQYLKLDGIVAECGPDAMQRLMVAIKNPKHRYAKLR